MFDYTARGQGGQQTRAVMTMSENNIERLAKRGNITSDNHRKAITCNDCRTIWYGRTDPFNETGATVATEFCPYCGGDSVEVNEELPGALLLNPGVDWPEDDAFVGGGASD